MAAKNSTSHRSQVPQSTYGGIIRPPLNNNHEQLNVSSLSSIMNGTPRQTREHDSILNDSMTTPPSHKSSMAMVTDHNGDMTEKRRSNVSRSELSFSGSDVYQMSLLTSRLADKEKRIEEYKDNIASLNASYDVLKDSINCEQQKLTGAQTKN